MSSNDLSSSNSGLLLHTKRTEVHHGGVITVDHAAELAGSSIEVERFGVVDGSHLGYAQTAGPGVGPSCSAGSGAGHGGLGGAGRRSCSGTCGRGPMYDSTCLPELPGSGGGHCSHSAKAGAGGSALKILHSCSYIEGRLVMNGESGTGGSGGGSGGSVWLNGDVIEGWGTLEASGGTATSDCERCSINICCCTHYGGGGGGGRISTHTSMYTQKVLQHLRVVPGGVAHNDGDRGTLCDWSGMMCSGHGTWNTSTAECLCNQGYVGDNCQYRCDSVTLCHGHGACDPTGGCLCDLGYVGYYCEMQCNALSTCSGNGTCSAYGTCICDPCFHGDDCSLQCSGAGQCVARQCQCDACHLGPYCRSECNEHGNCNNVTNVCDCDANWSGLKCTLRTCPGLTEPCSGHGVCMASTATCYCSPGWTGRSTDIYEYFSVFV